MRKVDAYFQDIPWEIVTDDAGKVIGEVYVLLPDPAPRKVKPTRPNISSNRKGKEVRV